MGGKWSPGGTKGSPGGTSASIIYGIWEVKGHQEAGVMERSGGAIEVKDHQEVLVMGT